ncbi:5-deoxy-glucuronate isomerase [Marinococcus halophilus]|uniref:5-deoxy-glucuronate isomerase n=1 Tax=Marinococcus halophilus TaxID=1371 RepID=UPI0009A65CAF|nr:5-deoxy-glucuronate isomerase [Marinococcus halophilus]
MSDLIVKNMDPNEEGNVLKITPDSAGWEYIGFEVFKLSQGQTVKKETLSNEVCIVILSGKVNIATEKEKYENIGHRMSVFEWTPPYSVYVPPKDQYAIQALTEVEYVVCAAPGKGTYEARLITPEDVKVSTRGSGNLTRYIHDILPEQANADSLLVVEVLTPQGSWSGFPPHKHDEDNLPHESKLEETYYHKINPENGFAYQRVYTDDNLLDENLAVKNDEAVLVPKGYHPVAAPPGYDVYFLNVMAGPIRTWNFKNDPEHEWLLNHVKVY